jgi:hypothetical protein
MVADTPSLGKESAFHGSKRFITVLTRISQWTLSTDILVPATEHGYFVAS